METPKRPKELSIITITGDVIGAVIDIVEKSFYGISFKAAPSLGVDVLILDLNRDIAYMTLKGREPKLWKHFEYPKQKEELLTELCNESKRRFEESAELIQQQSSKGGYRVHFP